MPDLHIRREHNLGLAEARKLAWKWAEDAEKKFAMQCGVLEGETSDTVEFQRTGVSGTLVVAADHFELEAKLGFLLGPFRHTIEAEILKNLDDLLGGAGAGGEPAPAKAAKAAKKKAK